MDHLEGIGRCPPGVCDLGFEKPVFEIDPVLRNIVFEMTVVGFDSPSLIILPIANQVFLGIIFACEIVIFIRAYP